MYIIGYVYYVLQKYCPLVKKSILISQLIGHVFTNFESFLI